MKSLLFLSISLLVTTLAFSQTANGLLEVKMTPQADAEFPAGRMLIDKTYSGPLDGKGLGQMLSFRSPDNGSANYVAIEHVTGTLDGRSGSFVLQHVGEMKKGKSTLTITILPDSGTDQLEGISGHMRIENLSKLHSYHLHYELPTPSGIETPDS
tara:strand:+ start:54 stop:518 length:465 start_codon:yes stop_codon:yes gene_type:complete